MGPLNRYIGGGIISLASLFGAAGCATFPSPATREITLNEKTVKQDIPLCERDIVALCQPNLFGVRAVNLNYVLRTGEIPMSDFGFYNDGIHWDKDDAFTRAVKNIETQSLAKIGNSTELQALLAKPCWDKSDREGWEEGVCKIVGEEMWSTPGLDKYRTHSKLFGHALNALSEDIENKTQVQEFDCKGMSFVRGCAQQRIENKLLPAAAPPDAFKKSMGYFVIAGGVCFGDESKTGGHTFTITPAGNIIEGTDKPPKSGYKKATHAIGFEDFVRGRPLVTAQNDVYGGYLTDKDEARAEAGKMEKSFTRAELLALMTAQECGDGHFITVSSRNEKDGKATYSLDLYQKRDAGSPLEAYALVARDAKPGDAPPALICRYTDKLTGKNYKFSHDFGEKNRMADRPAFPIPSRPLPVF